MIVAFIGTRGVPASYSGFETCVEQVGKRMAAAGHHVIVYCRAGHYREARPAEYLGMELRYLPAIPEKHLETLSHTALAVARLPRGASVVCMGVGNAPVVRVLEAAGRRTVFNVDGADWRRDKWGGFAQRYLHYCERLAARSRSTIVADAVAVQRYYQESYGRVTELVTYGAEMPAGEPPTALETWSLKPGGYVLFVGRLVPENAPHDVIEGVSLAGSPMPLAVVGDARYSDDYIAGLHQSAGPAVTFMGYQFGAAYHQLSRHAFAFVLGATVGGTHPVLVEQMAAGNCILARDTESNREVLGEAGLYWRAPADLAMRLASIKEDPELRLRLARQAAARAAALYDWDQVTERYLELCRRTVQEPSAGHRPLGGS